MNRLILIGVVLLNALFCATASATSFQKMEPWDDNLLPKKDRGL